MWWALIVSSQAVFRAGVTHQVPAGRSETRRQRRVLRRIMPRRLRFTREGRLLVLMTLGVGFAAVNSGNNLLYLIFGMQLSLVIISGFLSELVLRGLTLRRVQELPIVAGSPSLIPFELHNKKRRFSSLSLSVTELFGPDQAVVQRRGFVMLLRPQTHSRVFVSLEVAQRGVYSSAGLRIATTYPFGFFEKSRVMNLPHHYVVRGAPVAPEGMMLQGLARGVAERAARVGHGDTFHGLREHQVHDDARRIAWKVSARRGTLVVREHEHPASRRVMLYVANVTPEGEAARALQERVFDETLGLARALLSLGCAVGVASCDSGRGPGVGEESWVAINRLIARLPVRGAPEHLNLPFFDDFDATGVLKVGVMSTTQRQAGIRVPGEVTVLVSPPLEEAAT